MIKTDISRCFRVLANELRRLRILLEKYDVGNPRGPIAERITTAINLINEVRPLCESAEAQSLHSRRHRRLKQVAQDLLELEGRLTLLRAAAQVAASTRDKVATAMKLGPPAISKLEKRLVELAADDIQIESFDRAKKIPETRQREFVSDPDFVRKLRTRFRHDDALPPDEDGFSSAISRFMKAQGNSGIGGLAAPYNRRPSTALAFTLVPVMFATDRPRIPDSSLLHADYENRRGNGTLSYGVAEVSIPPRHITGRLERPVLWKLQFREDPVKHITIVKCEQTEMTRWKATAEERIKEAGANAALVFIHGFNVSFNDAIRRTAQIGWDLQFHGLITAFSWSSQGHVEDYLTDEDSADLAVPSCMEFLRVLREELGVETIHIIAHSLGNRVLIESLKQLVALPDGGHILDEVVFAAADYDADKFKAAVGQMKGKARRYTLYGSAKDRAIAAAKKARTDYPRAGDGGSNLVVVDGVESIDATLVGADLLGLGHSYFSDKRSVLEDLHYVLQSLPPSKRALLDEVFRDPLRYWVFRP